MKISEVLLIPFIIQGIAMFFDEFYFHHKRGLPKWERIGHPLDTLSVLACFLFIQLYSPTIENLYIYIGLSIFSCILITKDEFVHQQFCSGAENWLHAVLFILHPLIFIVAGLIWYSNEIMNTNVASFTDHSNLWFGLQIQTGLILGFLIYQIIYWSFISKQIAKSQK